MTTNFFACGPILFKVVVVNLDVAVLLYLQLTFGPLEVVDRGNVILVVGIELGKTLDFLFNLLFGNDFPELGLLFPPRILLSPLVVLNYLFVQRFLL